IDYSTHRTSTTLKVLNKFSYKCELSTLHCALRLRSVSTGYRAHIDNCVNGHSFSLVNVEWDHYSCQVLIT
ncbi:dhx37 protein, partial [Moniliophthora roreri]